ncbi:hypothetical protein R3P38DRAFT_3175038 [Favolaschia claudopus]|uniref:Uncharacterized protein n=1 Tax=Favolaschia claudopus TaxID=2862362 RepID=A0AAW0DCE2_9AGAR
MMRSTRPYLNPHRSMYPGLVIARVYAVHSEPRFALVYTLCFNSRSSRDYPIIEPHMTSIQHNHQVHDIHARVKHRDGSGRVTTTYFRCYFRCCSDLPPNCSLHVRGEIVIARMAPDDILQVDDFRPTDHVLADHVANVLAPQLAEYQKHRTPSPTFVRARLYPLHGAPRLINVPTLRKPDGRLYPIVEPYMSLLHIQPIIHDKHLTIMHRNELGELTITTFRCHFRRHKKLRHNHLIRVQGEVIITRMVGMHQVADLRPSDHKLVDYLARLVAPRLRDFQKRRTPVPSLGIVKFPGTF